MRNHFVSATLVCASLCAQAVGAPGAAVSGRQQSQGSSQGVSPVIERNRTLLGIVRTPGAQPATNHPTRSFAIMHAAIYDAVDAIVRTHKPYLVSLSGASPKASQEAAATSAAHDVLVALLNLKS